MKQLFGFQPILMRSRSAVGIQMISRWIMTGTLLLPMSRGLSEFSVFNRFDKTCLSPVEWLIVVWIIIRFCFYYALLMLIVPLGGYMSFVRQGIILAVR